MAALMQFYYDFFFDGKLTFMAKKQRIVQKRPRSKLQSAKTNQDKNRTNETKRKLYPDAFLDKHEREPSKLPASMFLDFNPNISPPYNILIDTNFVNFCIQNKVDLWVGISGVLHAKFNLFVSSCVYGELEKMGHKFRLALQIAKDSRIQRLSCSHKGTYADDCIVKRIEEHRCYIVATSDRELQRRIRKVPGVPILYVKNRKLAIEHLPESLSEVL